MLFFSREKPFWQAPKAEISSSVPYNSYAIERLQTVFQTTNALEIVKKILAFYDFSLQVETGGGQFFARHDVEEFGPEMTPSVDDVPIYFEHLASRADFKKKYIPDWPKMHGSKLSFSLDEHGQKMMRELSLKVPDYTTTTLLTQAIARVLVAQEIVFGLGLATQGPHILLYELNGQLSALDIFVEPN